MQIHHSPPGPGIIHPMKISTIFFDLDDTLYPASSGLWPVIRRKIGEYMHERLNIPQEQVLDLQMALFRQYGTTLRGLQATYEMDTDDYLAIVHDVPLEEYIGPNPVLEQALQAVPVRKFIFTNGDLEHARRVLRVLRVEQYFEGIIDINAISPYCKPMPEAFEIAFRLAAVSDPRGCVLVDDLPRNTRAAREMGMFSILYGQDTANSDADACLTDWAGLPGVLNGRLNEHG